jgi:osmotically-inducible protein OsmY
VTAIWCAPSIPFVNSEVSKMASFSEANEGSRREQQDYSRRAQEDYSRQQGSSNERGDSRSSREYQGERRGHDDEGRPEYQSSSRQGHYSDVGYGSESKGQYGQYGNREYGDERYGGIEGYREDISGGLYGANYGPAGDYGRGQNQGQTAQGEFGQRTQFSSQQSRRRGYRGRGPKGYRRTDERLMEEICDRLTDDDDIDASEIEVRVENCEVTLNGTVDNRDEKRRAEDIAEQVSGVTNVQNNLRVDRQGGC